MVLASMGSASAMSDLQAEAVKPKFARMIAVGTENVLMASAVVRNVSRDMIAPQRPARMSATTTANAFQDFVGASRCITGKVVSSAAVCETARRTVTATKFLASATAVLGTLARTAVTSAVQTTAARMAVVTRASATVSKALSEMIALVWRAPTNALAMVCAIAPPELAFATTVLR